MMCVCVRVHLSFVSWCPRQTDSQPARPAFHGFRERAVVVHDVREEDQEADVTEHQMSAFMIRMCDGEPVTVQRQRIQQVFAALE